MWRANVRATTNIAGVLMSSRVRSQMNCASMTAQMLARYALRWCTALMVVLVVMVVRTLLRFSLDSPSNSSASRSYAVCSRSSARDLESGTR